MDARQDTTPPPVSKFPQLDDLFEYAPLHIAQACGVNEDTVTRCLNSRLGRKHFNKFDRRWLWFSRDEAIVVCLFVATHSPKARRHRENFGEDSDTARKLRDHLARLK